MFVVVGPCRLAPWALAHGLATCMHTVELIFTHSFEQTRPDRRSLSGGWRPLQPLPYANGAFPPRSTWWFENTKRVRRPGVGGGLGEGGRRRRVRHGRGAWRCAPAHEHLPLARLTRHSRPILLLSSSWLRTSAWHRKHGDGRGTDCQISDPPATTRRL
jgi:hypothetical protein